DATTFTARIQSTRNGPIVTDILPPAARSLGPVSLRWQGSEFCEWISALLRLNRAGSVEEADAALKGWLVPTFSGMLADAGG
ncbi:penicillin acylase family protein, partial [Staphylococcus aureus]|uniref:penicillin acylase family protein n=1 Tax=Staphylococcus aureus TaxID=1280 RepID=UPI001E2C19EE